MFLLRYNQIPVAWGAYTSLIDQSNKYNLNTYYLYTKGIAVYLKNVSIICGTIWCIKNI